MSEVEEVVAIFGVGDYVWVPWSTIINSITIKVKNEPVSNKNSIKTNKLIRYWPAFVLERHVTTKLRKVAYARIVPTSTPQNGNSLSPKYLVKLIGLNVNQVFYEKSLRSWLSFNPKPLPEISSVNDFNLSGQDTSLSDITIEKLSALYVQAVQKVSNKLKPAFDPRDYNSETSKNLAAEPVNTNSSNPVRLRIIYNKNSKDSVNNSSNSKANKVTPTSIYKPMASINANTSSDLKEHNRGQEKKSDDETKKKTAESQANIGFNNSNDNITQTPSNDFIIMKEIKQVESDEQPIVLANEQESSENLNSFRSFKKKRGRKPSKNVIAKLDPSAKVSATSQSTADDSSLLRRTRNGSVFGKWRASKRSKHAQENFEQNDLVLDQNNNNFISNEDVPVQHDKNVSSISTPKAVSVQTKDFVSKNKRKLTIGVKKTPIDQSRCLNQVNKDDIELRVNESKRRKIQGDLVKEDNGPHENNFDEKSTETNSEPNNSIVQCNNEVKSMLNPDVTRTEFHKRKNEGKSKLKTQNTTQILQRKAESGKIKKEKKIRNRPNCNTKCVLNITPLDLNQTLEDNYMQISQQQDDVSGMIEMKNEQERIVNNMNGGNNCNNSLSLVFSSPLQSFRSVLGFGNIFSWNKRSIDT